MKRSLSCILTSLVISGCSTIAPYEYQSTSTEDPTLIFGDRFRGSSLSSPSKIFSIDVDGTKQCNQYKRAAALSDHWVGKLYGADGTTQVHVPAEKTVQLKALYSRTNDNKTYRCDLDPVAFNPARGKTYSVDIKENLGFCSLSVVELNDAHQPMASLALSPVAACQK